ncbi:MAG: right-handed parallel beta-helix repeat-containing protein [Spirulina sp. SIO3F2]|nr:right-handed parallel beta-helix repeat-containing protein [Spirulina sp. SIO3F2]
MLNPPLNIPLLTTLLLSAIPLPARSQLIPALETHPAFLSEQWLYLQYPLPIAQSETTAVVKIPKLRDRWGVRFQTGTELGDGTVFGELYSFIPFSQHPGSSTWFFEGQMRLFTNDAYGGNAKAGYRSYISSADLVWGSYLGFDHRQTDLNSNFWQLGLGAEVLAHDWEGRFNAYIPLGKDRNLTSSLATETTGTTGTGTASNLRFSGNQLLYDLATSTFRQQIRRYEAAASGFDLEGGSTLFDWLNGSLKGYLGTYFLDIPSEGAYLGIKGRLVAQLNETFSTALAISRDENFGTNVSLQMSAHFGGSISADANPLAQRLGSPVQRRSSIAVDVQEEVTTTASSITTTGVVAVNPTTGADYRFIHVTDGATGGTGTAESPFGEVTAAAAIAAIAGNDVIYVDAGDRSGLAGFTVPANVLALSTGVNQSLNIEGVGTTQLPNSGTGTLPLVNGTTVTTATNNLTALVSISAGSTLSGFELSSTVDGVVIDNISDVTVERNTIATTGNSDDGILLDARSGGTVSNATIAGNSISTTGDNARGIFAFANNGTINNATISGNSISTAGSNSQGIFAFVRTNGTISNATISGNSISTTDNNAQGISAYALLSGTVSNGTISGNSISTGGSQAYGITARARNGGMVSNATISGNSISTAGSSASGIAAVTDNGTISNATILSNLIQQAGQHSVFILTQNATDNICIAQFTGNTSGMPNVFGAGGNDLNFSITGGSTVSFVDFANVMTNNTGFDDISGAPTATLTHCP